MPTISDEAVAHICHEANRAYCARIGDPVALPWEAFGSDNQLVTIDGVGHARRGNPPEAMHESWRVAREGQGWVFGPVLDRGAKIHPNLIPYDQLPAAQQRKDALFLAIVRALQDPGK